MQATANGAKGHTDWTSVDWRAVDRTVRNLQKLMLRSHSNTLQSVRRVTQINAGRKTAGVDKVVVKTPEARGRLVDELDSYQPWRAKPARRVYIPKANGK